LQDLAIQSLFEASPFGRMSRKMPLEWHRNQHWHVFVDFDKLRQRSVISLVPSAAAFDAVGWKFRPGGDLAEGGERRIHTLG
jgi:hypothetical protein